MRKQTACLLVILLITFAIYLPKTSIEFVSWDRILYAQVLHSNDFFPTAWRLLTDVQGTMVPGYYAPLSAISLLADKFVLGSMKPDIRLTQLINLLFHCINGVLVYVLLSRVFGNSSIALLAAFFFLIHPLQVGAVWWFVERKTLLAGMFYLIAYLNFFTFRATGSWIPYALSLISFFLGLLSKPSLNVFPIVLMFTQFVFFQWPRPDQDKDRDMSGKARSDQQGSHALAFTRQLARSVTIYVPASFGKTLVPVLPFILLALPLAMITLRGEAASWDLSGMDLPLVNRPFVASTAIWFYVDKIVFPSHLMPFYPKWNVQITSALWWLPLIALCLTAALLFFFRKKISREVFWALGNFLFPLVPVIGFFKFGFLEFSYVADHFVYLSMIGASHCAAILIHRVWNVLKSPLKHSFVVLVSLYFLFLIYQTHTQLNVWRSSLSLWQHNFKENPQNWKVNSYLGHALCEYGELWEGKIYLKNAVELRPGLAQVHFDLANALKANNERESAILEYEKALQISPDYLEARLRLGDLLLSLGRRSEAIVEFHKAEQINPSLLVKKRLKDALHMPETHPKSGQ